MKFWITKYALSTGIQEVDGEIAGTSGSMVLYGHGYSRQAAHGEGKDWHRTREAAVERAKKMRVAKIASLRKSIEKLEKMTW